MDCELRVLDRHTGHALSEEDIAAIAFTGLAHDLQLLAGRGEAVQVAECVEICEGALSGRGAVDRHRRAHEAWGAVGEVAATGVLETA